jgi:HSP20 family protein
MTKKGNGNQELAPRRNWGLRRWTDKGNSAFDMFLHDRDGFHRELDRMFEDFWRGNNGQWSSVLAPLDAGTLKPSVDQTEDDKAYHVKVELPGMDEADVEVSFADGLLTISGEKKEEKEEKDKEYYRRERTFGAFRRCLSIPGEVDEAKINATCKKGILNVELPKSKEAQKKVKKIEVKAAA